MPETSGNLPVVGRVVGVFAGGPKVLHDAEGEWVSSIARDPVQGVVRLEKRSLEGDEATQPYHGGLENAVCLQPLAHYRYWNERLGLNLAPGGVGENLTLDGVDEGQVCVGDVLHIGSARLQISGARAPCETQARRVGRADWVTLTLQTMRTGMYARVLAEGSLQTGDKVLLVARPNPGLTLQVLLRCCFHDFQPDLAERLMQAEGLKAWWRERLERRLRATYAARSRLE